MFARTLELNVRLEKKPEFLKKVRDEILPLVKKQVGYVDIIALDNEMEPTKPLVVTLWHSKTDVERYERDTFPKVKQILEPFLNAMPIVKFYAVETTISQRLLETVAA
jgi:heme-degrading monooxygenase HmoA